MIHISKLYKNRFRDRCFVFDKSVHTFEHVEVSQIDHFCTAKRGELFAKQFIGERDFDVIFAVDVSSSQMCGSMISKIDFALKFVSKLSRLAEEIGDRVGLLLFAEGIEYYRPASSNLYMPDLRNFGLGRRGDPNIAARFLQNTLKVASVIFFISDFLYSDGEMDSLTEKLSRLSRKHDLVCLQLSDPIDKLMPRVGKLRLQDSESMDCVFFDSSDEHVASTYSEISGKWATKLRKRFRKFGLRFASIKNGCDVELAVRKSLDKQLV
jgi:uncharacterized protein (DUF58 family)